MLKDTVGETKYLPPASREWTNNIYNYNVNNVKNYPVHNININTLTDLKFSVLNSTTNEHIKNFLARVVVTEGPEVFGFDNITVSDGDFSVKHSFTNYGSHQILLRADTNSSIIPASFEVFIPLYQLNPDFTTYLIIGVGVPVSVVMTIILLLILKKKCLFKIKFKFYICKLWYINISILVYWIKWWWIVLTNKKKKINNSQNWNERKYLILYYNIP